MSRSQRRRRGRPYQPLPARSRSRWVAQLLVVGVGLALVLGSLALLSATPSP